MRRVIYGMLVLLALACASRLPAMLRPAAPVPEPPPPLPAATAVPDVAGPEEYARMLAHVRRFEYRDAATVARRFVDLVDARDRTDYVRGLLYRMRELEVVRLGDLDHARIAGVTQHNLMLFFRRQGTPGWRALGVPAQRAYERGLMVAPDDTTLRICRAGLLVDLGRTAEADRLFPDSPMCVSHLSTNDILDMAYYRAARHERAEMIWWLRRGIERERVQTRGWALESDDLDEYRNDPEVREVLGI